MKKLLVNFCTILLVLGVAGAANAIPYTDFYDAEKFSMNPFDSVFWTFDITNDGFNPETQDVTSASVKLNLSDDKRDRFPWVEVAVLGVGTNVFGWEVDSGNVSFALTSLMTLSDTGHIDAALICLWGDFIFNSSTLNAVGTEPVAAVAAHAAEPASMFLFGTGLIGIAVIVRKKFRKV